MTRSNGVCFQDAPLWMEPGVTYSLFEIFDMAVQRGWERPLNTRSLRQAIRQCVNDGRLVRVKGNFRLPE